MHFSEYFSLTFENVLQCQKNVAIHYYKGRCDTHPNGTQLNDVLHINLNCEFQHGIILLCYVLL
jgi:hypothetical protein